MGPQKTTIESLFTSFNDFDFTFYIPASCLNPSITETYAYPMNVHFSSTENLILLSKEIVDMIENIREQNHAPPLSRDQYDTLYETIRLMIVEQVFILRLLFEYLVESTLSNQCEYEEYECSLDQGSL